MSDLTGTRFGSLVVVERLHIDSNNRLYRCLCDCGRPHIARSSNLKAGRTSNCGCSRYKHNGRSRNGNKTSRLYYIWESMRQRCTNPASTSYHNYGGRGIGVCTEWSDFGPFYDWAMLNGYEPHLTIDRIDNDGDYTPENCHWATHKDQARNTRANRLVTFRGDTKCVMEWAEILDINVVTLHARLFRYGWPIERALTEKVRRRT